MTIGLFLCMIPHHPASAQTSCIANYSTGGKITRSPAEQKLLSSLPDDLREIIELRIADGFRPRGWASPFAQALYDDLIYTLAYLNDTLGDSFTNVIRYVVVDQFTSPVGIANLFPVEHLIRWSL